MLHTKYEEYVCEIGAEEANLAVDAKR